MLAVLDRPSDGVGGRFIGDRPRARLVALLLGERRDVDVADLGRDADRQLDVGRNLHVDIVVAQDVLELDLDIAEVDVDQAVLGLGERGTGGGRNGGGGDDKLTHHNSPILCMTNMKGRAGWRALPGPASTGRVERKTFLSA